MTEEEKETAKEIGMRLHILRVRKGLSQTELAEKLNCTQAFVSKWQSGKKMLSLKYLFRICKFFEIPFDYFNPENNNYLDYLKGPENTEREKRKQAHKPYPIDDKM